MSKTKEPKKKPEKLSDKDNPSLCEISGKIRLRVFEDFFVEKELPKWKNFQKEWDKIKRDLGVYGSMTEDDLKKQVNKLKDKTDDEKAVIMQQAKNLIAMDKAFQDDRWDIKGKHEREVDASVMKQAKFVREIGFWGKVRNALHLGKKVLPVEVAMDDLKDHIELTTTEQLTEQLAKLKAIEDNMRRAGQYKKADAVKQYRKIIAEENVVCAAGFESYVTEDTMIDFIRKSERGTCVDFLRYYEDSMPAEVVEKKVAADALMIFDNYVVAHYSDVIRKAVQAEKKENAKEEQKARERRRDPILFGLIKNSRKLYYICDWVTDTDDLTLEKLEKELGVTRGSLVNGAVTGVAADQAIGDVDNSTRMSMTQVRRIVQEEIDNYDQAVVGTYSDFNSSGPRWGMSNSTIYNG